MKEKNDIIENKMLMYEYFIAVRLLNKVLEDEGSKLAREMGLTLSQYTAFRIISNQEGLLISEIAKIGSWHISTVMTILTGLLKKSLVKYKPVQKGRGSYVYLTDLGRDIIKENSGWYSPKFLEVLENEGIKRNLHNVYKIIGEAYGGEHIKDIKEHILKSRHKMSGRE